MSDVLLPGRTSTSAATRHLVHKAVGIHISFWLVLSIAGAWSAPLCGVIIGAPTLRLRSDYLALVTLGFGEIIPQIFHNGDEQHLRLQPDQRHQGHRADRPDPVPASSPTSRASTRALGPFDLPYCSSSSRAGRRVLRVRLAADARRPARPGLAGDPRGRAGREHDGRAADADEAVRVRRRRGRRRHRRRRVRGRTSAACSPDRFSFAISIILLAMVVLGGMGNVWGVIIGALVLAWFNSTGLPQIGDAYQQRSSARTSTSRRTTS